MKFAEPSQKDRVLAALHLAGQRGVCSVDFLAPDVIDGGRPITRVAARIDELRADGVVIRTAGWRQSTRVYVLDEPATAPADGGTAQLFALPRRGASMYDDMDGAA